MAIEDQLAEILVGESAEEIKRTILTALAIRIRDLKVAIAQTLLDNKFAKLLDNTQAANVSLDQLKKLERQYQSCMNEWKRLGGDEYVGKGDEEEDGEDGIQPG